MSGIKSPDLFIDFGFYFMVSAALQRKVWLFPPERALFSNLYVTLTADPGVGKGLVIKEVTKILRYHKKPKIPQQLKANPLDKLDLLPSAKKIEMMQEQLIDLTKVLEESGKNKKSTKDERERLLIPIGADSTTFESLLEEHGYACIRNAVPACRMAPNGTYSHQSICFSLQELSSLFRKNMEDLISYLQITYDCEDFTYKTKHQGHDILKRTCVNLLAGTTPTFMAKAFDMDLLNQGMSSRMIFVYANKNRFEKFGFDIFSEEQLKDREHVVEMVKTLANVFGQVTFSPEADEYCKQYFEIEFPAIKRRAPVKLKHYYARKDVNLMKLCMALHFSDYEYHKSMEIPIGIVKLAMDILNAVEKDLLIALNYGGDSKIARLGKKILDVLRKTDEIKSKLEIWKDLYDDIEDIAHLESAITGLELTKQIKGETIDRGDKSVIVYKLIKV